MIRAFIAVDFQPTPSLHRLLAGLRALQAPLRVVRPENLHITLKFLGDVEEGLAPSVAEVMEEAAEGVSPFAVTLQGTGAFPHLGRPRVLWVGIKGGEPLVSMAQRLEERLEGMGFARERRGFSPHLTVARVKGGRGREEIVRVAEGHREEVFGEQRVETLRLKRSDLTPQGARYHDLATASLG